MRSFRWLLVVVLLVVIAAPATAARQKPISPSAAFKLPATNRCLAKAELRLQLRSIRNVRWQSVTIRVNGKKRTAPRSALRGKVFRLANLPAGTITLTITARATNRRSATARRTYRTCAQGSPPRTTPTPTPTAAPVLTAVPTPTPTPSPTPTATASPTPAPATPPAPGKYSANNYGLPFTFFVSAGGARVQDVSITVDLTCTPAGSFRDQIPIGDIPIAADGSFTSVTTQENLVGINPASYTYTFKGRFTGNTVAGTMREDVTYNDGVARVCTSGERAFTADRDANQGTQQILAPGSYSGTEYGLPFRFYVSPDGRHLQDVAITVDLECTPGGTHRDEIQFDDLVIAADGSFSGTAQQQGVIASAAATLKHTLSGHFHGTDSSGRPRVAGIMREEIGYNDGIARSCSSNTMPWRALRDTSQGAQPTLSPVPAGSYTATSYGLPFRFFVSPDGTKLQDVAVTIDLSCTPGSGFRDEVQFDEIPIAADGSFSATAEQDAVIANTAAKLKYVFRGHVHGTDSDGRARIAGITREDATYDNGVARSCSSNNLAFRALRDNQGALQTLSPPPAGPTPRSATASRSRSASARAGRSCRPSR